MNEKKNNDELGARHCFLPISLTTKDDNKPLARHHFLVFFPSIANNDDKSKAHCCWVFFLVLTQDDNEPPTCHHLFVFCSLILEDDNKPMFIVIFFSFFFCAPKEDNEKLTLIIINFLFYFCAPRKDEDKLAFIIVFFFFVSLHLQCHNPTFWKSVTMTLTLPKWGLGSPPGLLKLQSLIAGVKTPRLDTFFMPLESY